MFLSEVELKIQEEKNQDQMTEETVVCTVRNRSLNVFEYPTTKWREWKMLKVRKQELDEEMKEGKKVERDESKPRVMGNKIREN